MSVSHDSQLPLLFEGVVNGAVFFGAKLLQLEAAF
jgi:hypothetical protein